MNKLSTHPVTSDDSGIRLDRWFRRHFPGITHGQLQKLLRTGQIRVNGKRAEANTRLEAGQSIRIPPQVVSSKNESGNPNSVPRQGEGSGLAQDAITKRLKKLILYEDDDIIALNKPRGLAVQGGSGLRENLDDMVAVLARKGKKKPKLVHRLDRETSGVLLLARNASAAAKLSESFRLRTTQKIYWGLTMGVPSPERGKIVAPLLRRGEIMKVAEGEEELEEAKNAVTVYQVVERATKLAAFVALWPISGRTHQLRVHMAYVGTPFVGDPLYGGEKASGLPVDEMGKGMHLHARRLIMPHPRRGTIDIVAPLPQDMRQTWDWFGFDTNADPDFTDA